MIGSQPGKLWQAQMVAPSSAGVPNGAPSRYLENVAKQGTHGRSGASGQVINVRAPNGQSSSKIRFGSVTISGTKPAAKVIAMNVERSTKALERVTKNLVKPGVVLRTKRDVPHYSVAEGETGVFIRRLNGRTERGRVINGAFQVID